jgi:hypothetical protein
MLVWKKFGDMFHHREQEDVGIQLLIDSIQAYICGSFNLVPASHARTGLTIKA